MGRPLNKRFFAKADAGPVQYKTNPDGSQGPVSNEIKVNFNNGTAVKEGFIVKQKGSKRFLCSETGTADATFLCKLTTGKAVSTLTYTGAAGTPTFLGEMSISVQGNDAETYGVSKISGRVATLVAPSATGTNALTNTRQAWGFAAAAAGIVKVEEAGADDVANADDDDFTADA